MSQPRYAFRLTRDDNVAPRAPPSNLQHATKEDLDCFGGLLEQLGNNLHMPPSHARRRIIIGGSQLFKILYRLPQAASEHQKQGRLLDYNFYEGYLQSFLQSFGIQPTTWRVPTQIVKATASAETQTPPPPPPPPPPSLSLAPTYIDEVPPVPPPVLTISPPETTTVAEPSTANRPRRKRRRPPPRIRKQQRDGTPPPAAADNRQQRPPFSGRDRHALPFSGRARGDPVGALITLLQTLRPRRRARTKPKPPPPPPRRTAASTPSQPLGHASPSVCPSQGGTPPDSSPSQGTVSSPMDTQPPSASPQRPHPKLSREQAIEGLQHATAALQIQGLAPNHHRAATCLRDICVQRLMEPDSQPPSN